MKRREFLAVSGRTVTVALAAATGGPGLVLARDETPPSGALEQRIADVIETYDVQGNHRSATPADNASAQWLATQVRKSGAEPSLEPFTFDRVDPLSCYVRIAGRRIGGVPLFDAGFTGGEGVHGKLGPLGSDAEIGLAETEPFTLIEPRREQAGPVAQARRSRHKSVILITRGTRPGLFLLNALLFAEPFGPPTLQVSSAEGDWLKEQAQDRAEATLVAHVGRTPARAFNVTARVAGRDPKLMPLVVMTPYSGWWQCASERGGGLACWLEAIRALAAAKPARDCLFVACSGHELGFLGIDDYLKRRPDLVTQSQAWIYFGANIGAPRQPNLLHASDDALDQWTVAAMGKEGISVNGRAERASVPRGEVGAIHRGGGRYIAVLCGTDVFHHAADRWPDEVDVTMVARYARAFANGALELAQRS